MTLGTHPIVVRISNLVKLPDVLKEVFAQESEDTVVQKFAHGDQVVTTEGMFGAVLGEARRDAKGTYYKVAWENGSESINLATTLTPVRESQRIAADHALNGATDTPFDTVTFNLLETLGWGEAALKADIFKLITTIDRSGHKVADAKELVEASKALLAMLERQGK